MRVQTIRPIQVLPILCSVFACTAQTAPEDGLAIATESKGDFGSSPSDHKRVSYQTLKACSAIDTWARLAQEPDRGSGSVEEGRAVRGSYSRFLAMSDVRDFGDKCRFFYPDGGFSSLDAFALDLREIRALELNARWSFSLEGIGFQAALGNGSAQAPFPNEYRYVMSDPSKLITRLEVWQGGVTVYYANGTNGTSYTGPEDKTLVLFPVIQNNSLYGIYSLSFERGSRFPPAASSNSERGRGVPFSEQRRRF